MSVLDQKLKRDLYQYKGLLLTIVIINALGVAIFQSNLSLYTNQDQARRTFYAQCRMADFWVKTPKMPRSELTRLQEISGISELRGRITKIVTVDLPGLEKPLYGQLISMPKDPAPVINNVLIKRGGYFTPDALNQVLVNDSFARARNLAIGDQLHFLIHGRRQSLTIVGTTVSSEFIFSSAPGEFLPNPENFGVFYIPHHFAEEVLDYQGAINEIVGLLGEDYQQHPDVVLDQMETQLEIYGNVTTIPLKDQVSHMITTMQLRQKLTSDIILPIVFMVIATLILNVLMMRLAQQQRTVIGTLKAIGYSNAQLMGHFLQFGAIVGLLGGVCGSTLGYGLSELSLSYETQYFEIHGVKNHPIPILICAAIGLSILLAILGTVRGVWHVMRLKPAEAMRPKPPVSGKRFVLEAWPRLWKAMGFQWQLVLRDLFRHQVRTLTGMLVSAAGASLIFLTLYMHGAFLESLSFQFEKVIRGDFQLVLQSELDYGATFEAGQLPSVDYVEPQYVVACTFRNGHRSKVGAITGLIPTARLTIPRESDGSPIQIPDSGIVLTRRMAEQLDVVAGEVIRVEPFRGGVDSVELPVRSVVESYLGLDVYANFYYLNRLMGEEETVSAIQLTVDPNTFSSQAFYSEIKQLAKLQNINPIREQKANMNKLLTPMQVMVTILILFAGLLFGGSVLNSSLISLSERQQEVATYRVLGFTQYEVGALFLRENLCINVCGSLLGLPLGYWLCYGVMLLSNTDLFRLPFVISPSCWIVTVLAGIGFTLLAHLPVQRVINKMNWQMTLNSKE